MKSRLQRILPWALAALLPGFLPLAEAAEDSPHWRLFTARDGLAESIAVAVTISPRGVVWVRHSEGAPATRLDGYEVRTIPSPGEGKSPIYESRTGQIWCLSDQGLLEFTQGRWISYPVPEIAAENAANLRRRVHPIPLVPAERDFVFFLLPQGLYKFDAAQQKAQPIQTSAALGLGPFLDMTETRDGTLVISAQTGLARATAAHRRLTPQTAWQPLPVPPHWNLTALDRPIEDDEGGITVSALAAAPSGPRQLIRWDGQQWTRVPIDLDRLRQGWRDPEGETWALSRERLVRTDRGSQRTALLAGTLAGYHNDLAVGTNGVFWIATHEGLLLHTPRSWRAAPHAAGGNIQTGALLEHREGWLFYLAGDGLRALRDGQARHVPWPDDLEPTLQATDRLLPLPDGRLILGLGTRLFVTSPGETQLLDPPPWPGHRLLRLLGPMRNGTVVVLAEQPGDPTATLRLGQFDGNHWNPLLDLPADGPLGNDLVFATEAVNQDLWIGSGARIGFVRDGRLQSFGPAQGYLGGRALCWLDVGEGRAWCGGLDAIFEFDGRTWSLVRAGFDRIHALHRSRDGSIWVAAGSGLYRFFRGSWVSTSLSEGLPSLAVLGVLEDQRGRIWASTASGLSRYYPRTDLDPPRTFLTQPDGQANIARDGNIRFIARGLDKWHFSLPSRLLFSQRLDGGPWLPYSSESVLDFSGLAPGPHRLQVRAMDRDWNVDPQPVTVEFVALVPWYRVPHLVALIGTAAALIVLLAWLAVNRHLRLVRSHAEIERIVEERTAALHRANQELLHSQKMKALGTLAAGVAHDFNQILSIIKGSAQIIESNLDQPDKIRTRTQRIQTVVDQGSGIVRAMLGLSRQGKGELAPCEVNAIAREVVKLLGDRFLQEVKVRLELQRGLPAVRASEDLVQQMLLNLSVNAADAMGGRGEIILRTSLVATLPPGLVLEPQPAPAYACLDVVDHGAGIAPDILPRIFEPFFTTKALSSRRGTGLGLSMVYEFAKDIGAGLRVSSQPGTGSTFSILLPVAEPPPHPQG